MVISLKSRDNFKIRFLASLIIYFIFIILRTLLGIYNSYIIILPPSIIFILHTFSIDNGKLITRKGAYFSIGIFMYFLFIIFIYPSNKLISLDIVLIKAIFEELLFRLFMIGIVKKYLNFISIKRMLFVLIINSLIFSVIHTQYKLIEDYATIFVQSISYGLTYLSLGIFASIVSHTIWNLYLPNILPQIPILIVTMGNIYYKINRTLALKKHGKIMHGR